LGVDSQLVTAMHVSRLVIVMLAFPVLTRYIVRIGQARG